MRVLCLQYETRGDIFPQLTNLTKQACSLMGWEHIFLTSSEDLPPYWAKVYLVFRYLSSYEYVIWLDSDAALINPKAFSLEGEFIYCRDQPLWASPFNAGVFIVKNSPLTKELLEEWKKGYNPERWKKDPWVCLGPWAGEDYEQGYFASFILPKYKERLQEVPTEVLQAYCTETITEKTFSMHFPNIYKQHINSCVEKVMGSYRNNFQYC